MARAWLELDLDAVRANVRAIRRAAPGDLVAVVKADGYGHGAVPVARAALEAGATGLAVATAGEAVELRDAGVLASVQVLGPPLDDEVDAAVGARAALTIHELDDLARVRAAARRAGRPVAVHVKVDAGMHRFGLPPEQALDALAAAAADPALQLDGLMTHLPSPGDPDATRGQTARFRQVVEQARAAGLCPAKVHAAASAALFACPEARFSGTRAGIALVGLDPGGRIAATGTTLRPALSIKARVVRLQRARAGDPVGYGGRFVAARDTTLALVGAGYADGVPYGLTGKEAEVLLQGRRCPVVATVMMDYLLVDVTDLERAPAPGDVVTLAGQDGEARLGVEELAAKAGVIPYAVTCGLGRRLERVVLGAKALGTTTRLLRRVA